MNMKSKRIAFVILVPILLQLGRMIFKNIVFVFIDRTLLSDVIASIVYMSLIICGIIIAVKWKRIKIPFFPEKWTAMYKLFTVLVLVFFVVTPVVTKSYQLFSILSLIYNAIITVIFEELIFRGIIFQEISSMKNDFIAYISSTISWISCFGKS